MTVCGDLREEGDDCKERYKMSHHIITMTGTTGRAFTHIDMPYTSFHRITIQNFDSTRVKASWFTKLLHGWLQRINWTVIVWTVHNPRLIHFPSPSVTTWDLKRVILLYAVLISVSLLLSSPLLHIVLGIPLHFFGSTTCFTVVLCDARKFSNFIWNHSWTVLNDFCSDVFYNSIEWFTS